MFELFTYPDTCFGNHLWLYIIYIEILISGYSINQTMFYMLSGQYYTDDQFMNIYSFSHLYQWLYSCQQASQSQASQSTDSSQDTKLMYNILLTKSIDYCFRMLDQCERSKHLFSCQQISRFYCKVLYFRGVKFSRISNLNLFAGS